MSDFEEIQRVVNAYGRNIDDRTPEKFATEVFAPDADVDVGFGPLQGIEQIIGQYAAEIEKFGATVHVVSNLEVDVDGDTARTTAYVTFWHWAKDAASEDKDVYLGRYTDRFVRGDDGWRIIHRRFRQLGPPA